MVNTDCTGTTCSCKFLLSGRENIYRNNWCFLKMTRNFLLYSLVRWKNLIPTLRIWKTVNAYECPQRIRFYRFQSANNASFFATRNRSNCFSWRSYQLIRLTSSWDKSSRISMRWRTYNVRDLTRLYCTYAKSTLIDTYVASQQVIDTWYWK